MNWTSVLDSTGHVQWTGLDGQPFLRKAVLSSRPVYPQGGIDHLRHVGAERDDHAPVRADLIPRLDDKFLYINAIPASIASVHFCGNQTSPSRKRRQQMRIFGG
jgi:hypothetical protein